jgi:hypothetical protein
MDEGRMTIKQWLAQRKLARIVISQVGGKA